MSKRNGRQKGKYGNRTHLELEIEKKKVKLLLQI
jgi:hypothetical protein